MDENERLAVPRFVINQLTSPGVENSGRKNRRSNCVRDFSRFGRLECVPNRQQNGPEQAGA
jgi:hypothetical protein